MAGERAEGDSDPDPAKARPKQVAAIHGERRVTWEQLDTMADRVGASRDMVNRVLRDLATGGYVRISRKAIALLKRHIAKTLDDYENTLSLGIPTELG